jgi:hypothetical protein
MTSLIFTKIVCAIALLCLLGVGIAWYHTSVKDAGYQEASAHYEARIAQLDLLAQKRMQEAQAKAEQKEYELRSTIAIITTRRNKEQKAADEQIALLQRDIASGARRVSIASANRTPIIPIGAPRSTAAPAARTEPQAGCELDPGVANALVDIAARGDAAIRQANALVDFYGAAQNAINEQAAQ